MTDDWLKVLETLALTDEVSGDPPSSDELDAHADMLALEALTGGLSLSHPPSKPSPRTLDRLLNSVERMESAPPLTALAPEVCALLDLQSERIEACFSWFDDESRWGPGPAPGINIIPIRGGAARKDCFCCFVRLMPGVDFPDHWHGGTETTLILKGALCNQDGIDYWPGDTMISGKGGPHTVKGIGIEPCISLVIVEGGATFEAPASP